MSDIDVGQDLEQVNKQLEELVAQANKLNQDKENLMQQIHNLNGIAMYLRGKQEAAPESTNGVVEDFELTEEFPPEGV